MTNKEPQPELENSAVPSGEMAANSLQTARLKWSFHPGVWLCGAALSLLFVTFFGILLLFCLKACGAFWQSPITEVGLKDGTLLWGEVIETEQMSDGYRLHIRCGNREIIGVDSQWVNSADILHVAYPQEITKVERLAWGMAIGLLEKQSSSEMHIKDSQGRLITIETKNVVRFYQPNAMGISAKSKHYLQKLKSFLLEDPRESNTEGGIFPAIFGTVLLVIIMSLFVTPLGVLTALYLREYAKPGRGITVIRMLVNNLAGVPSVVFGVFGLGFFVYRLGGSLDKVFFAENLPTPTFGTGGVLWASLTLALLTVPNVIVATEEGLNALPRNLREASFALGATRAETIYRALLPGLLPYILTGAILAISRAAGEVAPLMLTGVVKLAPSLALDGQYPYLHLDQKFMHLGFHIYDLALQSPNVESVKPLVYATTLVLLAVIVIGNSLAIFLRARARKQSLGMAH